MVPCISACDADLAIKLDVFIYGGSYVLNRLSTLNLGIFHGDLGLCTALFEIVIASKDD